MRTQEFGYIIGPVLRKVFYLHLSEVPTEYEKWIKKESIDRNYYDDHKISEFGNVPGKPEGDATMFDYLIPGDIKRYQPTPFGLGFVITREMWDDDLHNVMRRATEALKRSYRYLYEVEAAKIFNYATDTGAAYLGIDGKPLLATDHPLLGGGTYANKPSSDVDISYTAVQTAMLNYHALVGERSLPIYMNASQVITGGQNQFNTAEIFGNTIGGLGPIVQGAANYDKNLVMTGVDQPGLTNVLASRFFTDDDAWFLLSDKAQHTLYMFERVSPEFDTKDDFVSGNVLAKGYCRFGIGFTDWRGVYGSTGA
jgi:hypothetical protein